jgi:alpha-beta hydrolase superfamily lysophospholipase
VRQGSPGVRGAEATRGDERLIAIIPSSDAQLSPRAKGLLVLPQRERVQFAGAFGNRIAARLDQPASGTLAYALFAHCFTCGKDSKAASWISRELVDRRIAVLRFDFSGVGESEGEFADTSFSTNVADLVAAAEFLRQGYRAPQVLIGHSLGGTAALAAAPRIPESVAVATIAAPSDTSHLRNVLASKAPEIMSRGQALVDVMGHHVRISRQMLADLEQQDGANLAAQLGRALLIFHSPADQVVSIEHARRLFEAAKHPKSFVALDGADHLLISRESDARYVAEILATWARRYLPPT